MTATADHPNTIKMTVKGLIIDPSSKMPVVLLQDEASGSILPIWIGLCEANSIAMELEGVKAPRPMTHDLIDSLIGAMSHRVEQVTIHTLSDSVFFATISLRNTAGEQRQVDARPSDALAIALRAGASILVNAEVLEQAKIDETSTEETLRTILERLRPEDLGEYEM